LQEARRRSTTVYLIQRVLPMLPPLLCEQLCSLNPGVDRLAFSVIWELTPRGEIVRQWMGRTVITSCCKLAYGHAQAMIDGRFDPEAGVNGPQTGPVPPTLHGGHAWDDVVDNVIALNGLACEMRRARFDSGALRLDNTKLTFKLDSDGNPDGVLVYESLDANKLIEEFMLLANRSVAGAICRAFPESALLRRHPPPNERKLEEFAKMCEAHGLEVNLSSAGALHASLEEIRRATAHDGAIADVIRLGATKPMNLAKYFCTGELLGAPEDWGHYALATPLYTHFTSPIRRYPDLVVHRTLAAALEAEKNLQMLQGGSADFLGGFESVGTGHVGNPQPFTGPVGGDALGALLTWHEKLWAEEERRERKAEKRALEAAGRAHGVPENSDLQGVATYCNERKMASKQAQEASDKVFLCVLLKRRRGMVSDARVASLGPKWATVYVLRFGLERRIYFEDLAGAQAEFFESTKTVVISEARESHRSAKKAAKKVAAKEEYGNALAEEAAELGIEAAVLPLTLKMLSSVPVVCYAITGNNRPMDVGVRLYL
jgi:DIS3-like exonuclease 2